MHKFLIILILLLSINIPASDYNLGIKIGGTYSNADEHDSSKIGKINDNGDYYWGTFFSFYGNKNVYKMIELQLELNLNQKGFQYEKLGTSQDEYNVKKTLQLIETVALIKLNFKNIKPYIGLFYSFTLYRKNVVLGDENKGDGKASTDNGYTIGLEYQYKQFLVDLRYNQSFGVIFDARDSEGETYYDNARQFVLSFGYRFF